MPLQPAGDDPVDTFLVRISLDDRHDPVHRLLQGLPALTGVLYTEHAAQWGLAPPQLLVSVAPFVDQVLPRAEITTKPGTWPGFEVALRARPLSRARPQGSDTSAHLGGGWPKFAEGSDPGGCAGRGGGPGTGRQLPGHRGRGHLQGRMGERQITSVVDAPPAGLHSRPPVASGPCGRGGPAPGRQG